MANVNLATYAQDVVNEEITSAVQGFMSVEDVISAVEDTKPNFDGDSFCPYYRQQVDVIAQYESEYGDDAEEFTDGQMFKVAGWQQAQTAYAYAIGYAGFSQLASIAKIEFVDALNEFEDDAREVLGFDDDGEIKIQVTGASSFGWASHDRELTDGTMLFESGQLDGCNGIEREINGIWVSTCVEVKAGGAL